jgi:hypothetical protein
MKIIYYSDLLSKGDVIFYQDLLMTFEWRNRRNEIIERDKKRCAKCHYSETYGHKGLETGIFSYITDDGTEEELTFTNKDGIIITENIPSFIVTDKPYFLHVHHKYYIFNQLPWEYNDSALITLCNWCHEEVHKNEKIILYSDSLLQKFEDLIPCKRCNGTGWFPQYKHVQLGICFECSGARFAKPLFIR